MKVAEEIEALAKRRGFFWPAAQLYNPVSGFWNYGPLGTSMKNKFVDMWRKWWVRGEGAHEIDTSDILPEIVWQASGHTEGFNDKQVLCVGKEKHRWRVDKLIQEWAIEQLISLRGEQSGLATQSLSEEDKKLKNKMYSRIDEINNKAKGLEQLTNLEQLKTISEGKTLEDFDEIIEKYKILCPKCKKKLSKSFVFNLMFDLKVGPTGETKCYLKPETTQSSVLDFPFVYRSQRGKLPLKIAQVGKSFRNEISPRQIFIRMREFWMAELQVFFNSANTDWKKYPDIKEFKLRILPAALRDGDEDALEITVDSAIKENYVPNQLIGYYLAKVQQFYEALGFDRKYLRFKELLPEERAHYSKVHWDFEVFTEDFGWIECVNNAWRTDYDLSRHAKFSGQSLSVFENEAHVLPNMYEPSFGIDRTILMLLMHAYHNDGKRVWLTLPQNLAPYQAAIFPLVKKEGMDEKAEELHALLTKQFDIFLDPSDSIGRRYARADEIGIPYCITVDGDTMKAGTVTMRDRDTTAQIRVPTDKLTDVLKKLLAKEIEFSKAGTKLK